MIIELDSSLVGGDDTIKGVGSFVGKGCRCNGKMEWLYNIQLARMVRSL